MKKVIVVGAGFSGLSLAYELAKLGFAVEIFDRSTRVGGLIGTLRTPHGLAETAANALMLDANVETLLQELGVQSARPLPSAKKRFIFRGKPRQWPLSFGESLRFAKQILFHILTRKHFLTPQKRESVFTWGQRNLGSAAVRYLLTPALQGIYAGDIQKMSSFLILSPLFQKKRSRYRGLVSGAQGMQDIINALEKKLQEMKVLIHKQSPFVFSNFESSHSAVNSSVTVIATSARSAAQILETTCPQLSASLAQIEMASIMTVTTFWQKSTNRYQGFGCLIPRSEGLRTLGILINSSIFTGRNQTHSETFIFGGATDPTVLQLSDEEVKNLIRAERKKVFQVDDLLLDAKITRWPEALPHYTIDLERILEEISLPENLYLHGNYLGGIGLTKILDRSKKLAQEIKQKYG